MEAVEHAFPIFRRNAGAGVGYRQYGVPRVVVDRDVDAAAFPARSAGLDEVTRRRACHIVSENERVLQAVAAMRKGDAQALGVCLDASHASLRDDFEVSNQALDVIVAIARRQPGCYGARRTGAGFGGCAVALVRIESAEVFSAAVAGEYQRQTGLSPSVYISQPGDGAGLVNEG
jgi:galactokinase